VLPTTSLCPNQADEVAESYCMDRLSESEAAAFEAHYLACPRCAELVEETERFVEAMKGAAQRLRTTEALAAPSEPASASVELHNR